MDNRHNAEAQYQNSHKTSSITVLLLCGLPASGKSTMAQFLMQGKSKEFLGFDNVVHVEYDELVDQELFNTMNGAEGSDVSFEEFNDESLKAWKTTRQRALQSLDVILDKFRIDDENRRDLVIMDDNFYLRSMRRNVYSLCQKHSAKITVYYATIWVDRTVKSCLELNTTRTGSRCIPNEVIEKMNDAMEPPDTKKASWETCSLQINATLVPTAGLDSDDLVLKQTQDLVSRAAQHPVQPVNTVDLELLQQERQATLDSRLHSYDGLLRSWVGLVAQRDKTKASLANTARKEIMQKLRLEPQTEPKKVMAWFLDAMKGSWRDDSAQAELALDLEKSLEGTNL